MPRRLKKHGQKPHQIRKPGPSTRVSDTNQNHVSGGTSARGLLNVAWHKDNIVIVERTDEGVVVRERRAEYSCFIRNDIDDHTKRLIRNHRAVLGFKEEGDWCRVLWRSTREREQLCEMLEQDGVQTFEGDINPVRRFMTETDLPHAAPRVAFLDLETDSRTGVRKAAAGNARILCWAVVDAETGKKYVDVLEENTDVAERALLQKMFKVLEQFDLVAAWNGDHFDFPVIQARSLRRRVKVNFDRWLWLDHMDIFIRMNTMAAESGDEKQSYALQAIATAILGEGKDDFDSSKTWEAWVAGGAERRKLVRYCVKDTDLLRRIENENGYIGLLLTLAETCNVFADTRGANPTIQAEGFLLKLAKQKNYKFPSNFNRGWAPKFKGAYVMEPQAKGIVKNVHVGDFASLYPSIIVTWNMSPETVVEDEEELRQLNEQGLAPDDGSFSLAPLTGKWFRTDVQGILPQAVLEVMRLRKHWNELKATFPPGSVDWVRANRKATAYKIAANSFYGVVGSPMSRFFNRDVAESVTQAGAWLILETIKVAEKRGMSAIYGDTDSLFIAGCTRTEFEVFVAWANESLYPILLKDQGCKENLIKLAYEKEFERVIFTAAKKYCGRYVHFKGTMADETSKPEVKGLEYKRGDSIRLARQFQAEVVDLLVGMVNGGNEDPYMFQQVAERWRDRVLSGELELDDVAVSKSLSKRLNEYSRKRKKDGTWAKQLPHIELARKLEERGEEPTEGTKISYFVFDASTKGDVEYRMASEWDGTCDRFEVWEKFAWPPTFRLLQAAFPGVSWTQYSKVRPKRPRAARKAPAGAVAPTPQPPAETTHESPLRRRRRVRRGSSPAET